MGQLSLNTSRLSIGDTAPADHRDYDLRWLCLLDQLYGLIECDGFEPLAASTGPLDWPPHWQPLIRSWAARIGARSIQVVEPLRVPSMQRREPLLEPLLSRRRGLSAQPPAHQAHGPAILAQSMSAEGFTAGQEREFHAFCSQLYAALGLRASLDAVQQNLACLYSVVDALPMSIAMLDEQLNVVLLNARAREWLARTERLALHERRLCLPSRQAAFDRALHEFVADPFKPHHHLHLDGLDIDLKKLAYTGAPAPSETNDLVRFEQQPPRPQFSVLLLIHERCEQARPSGISAPPAALARHLQDQFALTDKELALAWNLAQGVSLKQYAALSARSIETARAQLKPVFRKLGITSQAGIGMILFESLHAVTLQSMGAQLATALAERSPASQTPIQALPWP